MAYLMKDIKRQFVQIVMTVCNYNRRMDSCHHGISIDRSGIKFRNMQIGNAILIQHLL